MEAYTSREVVVSYLSAPGWVMYDTLMAAIEPDRQPTTRLRFEFPSRTLRRVRIEQTAQGPDEWRVAEMRVLRGGAELPRSARWRLRAWPNPWYAPLAFDNSPVTAWASGESVSPGMYLELDFGRPETIDSVVLEGPRPAGREQLRLEGLDARLQVNEAPLQPGLRRAAIVELKSRGIRYMVVFHDDWHADDYMMNSYQWGIRQLLETGQIRVYELL
jgi:hypothetical protein